MDGHDSDLSGHGWGDLVESPETEKRARKTARRLTVRLAPVLDAHDMNGAVLLETREHPIVSHAQAVTILWIVREFLIPPTPSRAKCARALRMTRACSFLMRRISVFASSAQVTGFFMPLLEIRYGNADIVQEFFVQEFFVRNRRHAGVAAALV